MITPLELARAAEEAARRIRPHVRRTWLEPSAWLAEESGAEVLCKLENLQHAGSFKTRGALNKLLRLSAERLEHGVVAASTGNHGAAVAWALRRLGAGGLIFVPADAEPGKLAAIERLGGELVRVAGDPVEAERAARRHAAERDLVYLSPYNDLDVVAGQGTVAVELLEELEQPDAVFVAVGGGGLVGGIGAVLERRWPAARVVGCSPAASPVMVRSVAAGRIVELDSRPTLSDGTAGGIEPGAVTFELCRELVDEWITVSEAEIAAALRGFIGAHSMLIEGAAAVAVAAFRKTGERLAGRRVAIVICGGNLGLERLREVLG